MRKLKQRGSDSSDTLGLRHYLPQIFRVDRNRLSAVLRNPKARQAEDRGRWVVYFVGHARCQCPNRCKFGRLIELLLGPFDLSGLSSNLRARSLHHQSNHQGRKSNRGRKERKDENNPSAYVLVKKLATAIKRNVPGRSCFQRKRTHEEVLLRIESDRRRDQRIWRGHFSVVGNL